MNLKSWRANVAFPSRRPFMNRPSGGARHARRTATFSRLDRCDRSAPKYIEARPRTEPRHGAGKAALRENSMTESVYKVIELVGSSTDSWENAEKTAVERAAKTGRSKPIAPRSSCPSSTKARTEMKRAGRLLRAKRDSADGRRARSPPFGETTNLLRGRVASWKATFGSAAAPRVAAPQPSGAARRRSALSLRGAS